MLGDEKIIFVPEMLFSVHVFLLMTRMEDDVGKWIVMTSTRKIFENVLSSGGCVNLPRVPTSIVANLITIENKFFLLCVVVM